MTASKGLNAALPMVAPTLPIAALKPFMVLRIWKGNVCQGMQCSAVLRIVPLCSDDCCEQSARQSRLGGLCREDEGGGIRAKVAEEESEAVEDEHEHGHVLQLLLKHACQQRASPLGTIPIVVQSCTCCYLRGASRSTTPSTIMHTHQVLQIPQP